jgi:hypothetical protein
MQLWLAHLQTSGISLHSIGNECKLSLLAISWCGTRTAGTREPACSHLSKRAWCMPVFHAVLTSQLSSRSGKEALGSMDTMLANSLGHENKCRGSSSRVHACSCHVLGQMCREYIYSNTGRQNRQPIVLEGAMQNCAASGRNCGTRQLSRQMEPGAMEFICKPGAMEFISPCWTSHCLSAQPAERVLAQSCAHL